MLEALAFVIMVTNPMGQPAELGYPTPVYQPHQPVVRYDSLTQCNRELARIRQQALQQLQAQPQMPQYVRVQQQRINSLSCLPPGTGPQATLRTLEPKPLWRWRIGHIDEFGYFQGQSLEMRQFSEFEQCQRAYDQLLHRLMQQMRGQGKTGLQLDHYRDKIRMTYRCHQVMPPPKLVAWPAHQHWR